MNYQTVVMISGCVGLLVSLLTVGTYIWRDGKSRGELVLNVGTIQKDVEKGFHDLNERMDRFSRTQESHISVIGQFMARFDGLEGRMNRLERQADRTP